MKLAFLWYFDKASHYVGRYRDGLRAAMELLSKDYQVDWYYDKDRPDDTYDAIVFWDDSNSGFFDYIDNYHAKKAICLTTDPQNFDNLRKVDTVFCESTPVYEAVRAQGLHAVKAFGTDTDFFTPGKEKDIEYFYPATFSPWKRQSSIAYLGDKLHLIGTIQPDGYQEYQRCFDKGVKIEVGYFPVKVIKEMYQRTKRVIIPAIHGSERTCIESMASGIKPEVNTENIKAYSYIKELEESKLTPREFVVKNYSAQKYASDIIRGIT